MIKKSKLRADDVFVKLKERILHNKYAPGEALTELGICAEMNVSRTPVREVFRRLESQGLVQIIPHKGAIVVGLTEETIREVYIIRQALEGICANRTARRISESSLNLLEQSMQRAREELDTGNLEKASDLADALHKVILNVGGTPRIRQIVDNIRDLTNRLSGIALYIPGRMEQSLNEHIKVVEALRQRDADGAEKCIRDHILGTQKDVLASFHNMDAMQKR